MWAVDSVLALASAFVSSSSSPNQAENSESNPITKTQRPSHSAAIRSQSQVGHLDMGNSSPRQAKPVMESSTASASQKSSHSATTRSQSNAAKAREAEKESTAPPPPSLAKQIPEIETATTPMPQKQRAPATTRSEAEAFIIPNQASTRTSSNPARIRTTNPPQKPLYRTTPPSGSQGTQVAETRMAYLAPSPPNHAQSTTRSTATPSSQTPSPPVATRSQTQASRTNSHYHNSQDRSPAVAKNVPNPVASRSVGTPDFRAQDTEKAVHSSGAKAAQQNRDASYLQRIQDLELLVRQRENEINSLKALNQRTSEKSYRYDSQIRHLQDRVQEQEITLQSTQELLDVKTKELAAANAFLTLTDGAAVADACRELETLNSEIFQFAALISESLTFDCTERSPVSSKAQRILGHPLHNVLLEADADCMILAVQVSIQVVLSTLCSEVISSWCVTKEDFSSDLKKLYEYFHHQGPARIAGTWRSLTRARVTLADSFDFIHNGLVEQFTTVIAEVLLLAGWSKSPSLARKTLLADHKPRIADICSAALKLNKMIGEQITSVDLDIHHIAGEEMFNPSFMTDMYEENEGDKAHVVLGTTELGMIQRERQGTSARLMLPKVVLLATFQD
ncbi:hypothetical protein DL96DRAFT_1820094 [Flagelloscypha sp. PMI_526]|nr:hypothetical protein DL96DRAFT_1820094 [Flagelloscypha sp. PMI_526]